MKKLILTTIITILCGLMLFVCVFAGCADSSTDNTINNNDSKSRDVIDEEDNNGGDYGLGNTPMPKFENYYTCSETSSFAKLKIVSVYEDLYRGRWIDSGGQFVIIECEVEEDYYGKLEPGTIVRLQALLGDGEEDLSAQYSDFKDVFQNYEFILAYMWDLVEGEFVNLNTNKDCDFSNVSRVILSSLEIIPIKNNKLELIPFLNWLEEYKICRYYTHLMADYFQEWISVEELAENIKAFADSQR